MLAPGGGFSQRESMRRNGIFYRVGSYRFVSGGVSGCHGVAVEFRGGVGGVVAQRAVAGVTGDGGHGGECAGGAGELCVGVLGRGGGDSALAEDV